ncbi:MAG: alpha/beta hydrolase-fold protein [Anaerolineales bacterium]|nr:alpha/beta hydrolase-fold protein [Anaerolineales bacterium]
MFLSSMRPCDKSLTGWWVAGMLCLFVLCLTGCDSADPPGAGVSSPAATIPNSATIPSASPTFWAIPSQTATPSPVAEEIILLWVSPTLMDQDCWHAGGRFETGALETDLLRQPLEFRVYLPPCYDEQMGRAYPVLYLIHGQSYNDDQWERLGAGRIAGELAASRELPPFLIVMPRDRLWSEPTEDRFGQAVVEVLLPWIDSNYRTLEWRESRAVGGLSRGAAWALHLGMNYPGLFSAVGMHSGFAFHSDTPYVRPWLDESPQPWMPRFYLDIAANDRPDIYDSAVWLESLLTGYNIPHEWHIFTGYHEEAYWQAHVAQYLRWYAQEWAVQP